MLYERLGKFDANFVWNAKKNCVNFQTREHGCNPNKRSKWHFAQVISLQDEKKQPLLLSFDEK